MYLQFGDYFVKAVKGLLSIAPSVVHPSVASESMLAPAKEPRKLETGPTCTLNCSTQVALNPDW